VRKSWSWEGDLLEKQKGSIIVCDLQPDITENQVRDLFRKYGEVKDIELRKDETCVVEFSNSRDAEDAIDGRDDCSFKGKKIRVKPFDSRSRSRSRSRGRSGGHSGGRSGGRSHGRSVGS